LGYERIDFYSIQNLTGQQQLLSAPADAALSGRSIETQSDPLRAPSSQVNLLFHTYIIHSLFIQNLDDIFDPSHIQDCGERLSSAAESFEDAISHLDIIIEQISEESRPDLSRCVLAARDSLEAPFGATGAYLNSSTALIAGVILFAETSIINKQDAAKMGPSASAIYRQGMSEQMATYKDFTLALDASRRTWDQHSSPLRAYQPYAWWKIWIFNLLGFGISDPSLNAVNSFPVEIEAFTRQLDVVASSVADIHSFWLKVDGFIRSSPTISPHEIARWEKLKTSLEDTEDVLRSTNAVMSGALRRIKMGHIKRFPRQPRRYYLRHLD
jgi:hypothetical protein